MTLATQTQALDDEDQMAQALSELRADRSPGESAAGEVTPEPVAAVADATTATQTPESTPAVEPTEPAPATDAAQPQADAHSEQLKAAQAELHKMRTEIGRISALQRKYHEAVNEAAQLREKLATQAAPVQQAEPATSEADKLAEVAEQVKDFPELAGIVAAVRDSLAKAEKKAEDLARNAAAQVIQPLEPLSREHAERALAEQQAANTAALQLFNKTYPTAPAVVQSPDFQHWLTTQPRHIQYAFAKGETPQEALTVMDTYDMHLRRSGLPTIAQLTEPEPKAAPATQTSTQRLQRAAGIPSRASAARGALPPEDDFDAAFEYYRNKRLAAQRAQA